MPPKNLSLASAIYQWRTGHDMTQAEAAETLRVPLRSLQNWEQGAPCRVERLLIAHMALLRSRAIIADIDRYIATVFGR